MRTHDIETTNSFASIGTLDMENENHIFFIHQFMGHYKLFIHRKFFEQILEDGAINQTLQYEISHMCAMCKPHSCP
jgi:hypothetical protein